MPLLGLPGGLVGKNLPASVGDARVIGLIPGLGRSPGGGHGQPTPVFLPGDFHGQRSLQFDGVAKSWTDWSNLAGTHTPPPSRPCESGFAVCHDARWFAGTWKFQRPQRFWWEWAWFPAVSSKRQKKLLALRLGKKSCTSSHFSRRDMKWLLGCPVIPEVARDPLSKRVERGGREGLLWQTAYFSWIPPLVRGPAG